MLKCSRCNRQLGKNFIYLENENLVLHPKCKNHHDIDKKFKEIFSVRRQSIIKPARAGLMQ